MHLETRSFPPLLKGHAVKAPKKPFAEACRLARRRASSAPATWCGAATRPRRDGHRARARGGAGAGPADGAADDGGAGRLPGLAVPAEGRRALSLAARHPAQRRAGRRGAPRLRRAWPSTRCRPGWWSAPGCSSRRRARSARIGRKPRSARRPAPRSRAPTSCSRSPRTSSRWLNTWQDEGFRPVHDQWLFRAEGREAPVTVAHGGERCRGPGARPRRERQPAAQAGRREGAQPPLPRQRRAASSRRGRRDEAAQDHPLRCLRRARVRAGGGAGGMGGVGRLRLRAPRPGRGRRARRRQAFANGFLGVASFGRSTFATVAEATPADRRRSRARWPVHFVAAHGAPGLEAALAAAGRRPRFVARPVPRRADQHGLHRAPHVGARTGASRRSSAPSARPPASRRTPGSGRWSMTKP